MAPTKENTLCLPIKQLLFDEVIAGTKKQVIREIKDTTYKNYLLTWKEGSLVGIHFDEDLISEGFFKYPKHPMVYNNGVYPFYPIPYKFLNLNVECNNDCDSLLVKVENIHFEPMMNNHGKIARYIDDGVKLTTDNDGELCMWQIVYSLGKIFKTDLKSNRDLVKEDKSVAYSQ
ncbi:MAG: ASCH domain-containing protein [Candidatus Saccharimonadaceae bacterium]